jgi:hypothetical protein
MHALSDDQQVERLEKKVDVLAVRVDEGFAEMRVEFKAVREEMHEQLKAARGEQTALVRLLVQMLGGSSVAIAAGVLGLAISHL